MKQLPKISIITPTFNAETDIETCIRSVANQTWQNKEHLIIDGQSTDGTLSIVRKYAEQYPHIKLVSEKDEGIYDAMNKGIDMASGEWVYFLGSDDVLYSDTIVDEIFSSNEIGSYDIVYGNVQWGDSGSIYDGEFSLLKLMTQNICHQAMFYKKSVFVSYGKFDLKYRVLADYVFNISCFKAKRIKINYIDFIIAKFGISGHSSNITDIAFWEDRDLIFKENFPPEYILLEEKLATNSRQLAELDLLLHQRNLELADQHQQLIVRDQQISAQDQQISAQDQQLSARDQQISVQNQQIAEQNQQIAEQDQRIAALRSQVTEIGHQVNERDQQLAENIQHLVNRNHDLAEANKTIALLTAEINATQNTIQKIYDSLSWKITAPLRALGTAVQQAKRVATFSLLKAPQHLSAHNVKLFLKYAKLFGWKVTLHEAYKAVMATSQAQSELSSPVLPTPSLHDKSGQYREHNIDIAVIIPTKNAGDSFYQLLTMIRSQKGIREIEIVVVDSGSTDNTVPAAKEYGAKVIEIPPESFSHSYARNLGAENATSEYLFFTVQDALIPSESFFREFYEIYSLNEVAAVSCAEYPREDADLFYRCCCWNHYEFLEVNKQDRILERPAEENFITLRKNGQLSDIANFISRDLFMKYKYRDDYAEDLDLGMRLIKDDFRLAFLSSIKIIHSHNRPAFYYLKRGHVDQLFLTKKFPDYPMAALPPEEQPLDILAAYAALCSMVLDSLSRLKLPGNTRGVFELIKKEIEAPKEYGNTPIGANPYVDSDFLRFMQKVKEVYSGTGIKAGTHKSNLLLSLGNFLPTIGSFMTDTTDTIDEYAIEELKFALFKAFALLCGVSLATSMIIHETDTKKLFESIGINLREGV